MRNIKYGRFVDFKINYDYDDWGYLPIGIHIAYRRLEIDQAKSLGYEYYLEGDRRLTIIINPSVAEKLLARIKYVFNFNKKKLAGYRNGCDREE